MLGKLNNLRIVYFLIPIVILLGIILIHQKKETLLEISYIDIGQGSAAYIKTPKGFDILVDAGKNNLILEKLKQKMSFFDKKINYMIATHLDLDHIGGFKYVLDKYYFDKFLYNGKEREIFFFNEIKNRIKKNGTLSKVSSGNKIIFPSGAYIEILYPNKNIDKVEDQNNLSIVFKLTYGDTSFLFTGDVSKYIENLLVKEYGNKLNSDILLVSHHGSNTSSDPTFLDIVDPEFAVISAGKNNTYGHPHKDVIKSFKDRNIKILETSILGDIDVYSDSTKLIFK